MNVIDLLSDQAKLVLSEFSDCNQGVILLYDKDRGILENDVLFDSIFARTKDFGRYFIDEYPDKDSDDILRQYFWLNSGKGDDSGRLIGFLIQTAREFKIGSVLFKLGSNDYFSEINNPDPGIIKYDHTGHDVELVSLRSYHSRTPLRW